MENKKYKVIVVEDILQAQKLIIKYLSSRPELELVDIAKDGKEALDKLKSNKYDLLLLDVNLPVMFGIDVLENLEELPYVIFITAHDEYAVKAFEFGAVDYLLKPIENDRFNQAIDRFLNVIKSSQNIQKDLKKKCLFFKEKRKQRIVPFDDIIYLSSSGKHTIIHCENEDFETSDIIKNIGTKLPSNIFSRIHKQYIVNIQYIKKFEHNMGWQYRIVLKDFDDTILPVGKKYVSHLKELF